MSDAFRTKAQHFAQQVISDVKATNNVVIKPEPTPVVEPVQPVVQQPQSSVDDIGQPTANEPQAYHEENRLSEFGKNLTLL